MRTRSTYRKQIPEPEVYRMESRLGAALHEVDPRPDFVSNLRTRLAAQPMQARRNTEVFQYVILSLVGVTSGVLLILAVVRGIYALLGRFGLGRAQKPVPAL